MFLPRIKPHGGPGLHVFRRPVFTLWCHESHIVQSKQGGSSRPAEPHNNVCCDKPAHGGITYGCPLAQQQKRRIAFRDIEHLFKFPTILRQIDDTAILLHNPGMFQIKNISPFRKYKRSRLRPLFTATATPASQTCATARTIHSCLACIPHFGPDLPAFVHTG